MLLTLSSYPEIGFVSLLIEKQKGTASILSKPFLRFSTTFTLK